MKTLAIVALCVCAAVVYGIIHDQITARICVEYFTIGHPPVFDTDSPTLLGLGWGVIATWWVGLILGVPLALAARVGPRPKKPVTAMIRPLALLLLIMAVCALLCGVIGYCLAVHRKVFLMEPLASALPPKKQAPFIADMWAHLASYGVGFIGGIVLIVTTWHDRKTSATTRNAEAFSDFERTAKALTHHILHGLACTVGATEAIAYAVEPSAGAEPRFTLITHIRPDWPSQERIEAARAAFRELAIPSIGQCKDGAIEVVAATAEKPNPQFCLIDVITDPTEPKVARAFFAFVVRCADSHEAKAKLLQVKKWI